MYNKRHHQTIVKLANMVGSSPTSQTSIAISALFNDDTYADLVVVSGDWRWNIHRVVLNRRAPSLLFQLERMAAKDSQQLIEISSQGQVTQRRQRIEWPIGWSTKEICNAVLQYIYKAEYRPLYDGLPYQEDSELMTHMHVPIFAIEHGIKTVKAESLNNFRAVCRRSIRQNTFADAVKELFSEQPVGGDPAGLQEVILQVAAENSEVVYALPDSSAFWQTAENTPFGSRLAKRVMKTLIHEREAGWDVFDTLFKELSDCWMRNMLGTTWCVSVFIEIRNIGSWMELFVSGKPR